MDEQIVKDIARLHGQYGIYPKDLLISDDPGTNIIARLKEYSQQFDYLNAFYKLYCETYLNDVNDDDYSGINTSVARGVDLPYIGENALKTGRPKFFFVFEGSLTDHSEIFDDNNKLKTDTKLSITVLSNLWAIDKEETINSFVKVWWKPNDYRKLVKDLRINKTIAENSYVTDAKRIGDLTENRKEIREGIDLNTKLIYEEIKLLNPELVICVGNTAKNIVGMRYIDQKTKFHAIRFPKYIPKEKAEFIDDTYGELEGIIDTILNK